MSARALVAYRATPLLLRRARQRARAFGAVGVSTLASDAIGFSPDDARTLVSTLAGAQFLDDEWFWLPDCGSSRLAKLTFRVLAVRAPLEVAAVRAGVSRAYRRREAPLVPPEAVLAALYREHPSFDVDTRGRVRAAEPVDCTAYLGKNDRLFVAVFSESWTGVLDTSSFRDACVARGMTPHSFARCKTYSVVLDHPVADLWCLRGTRVSPITAAALRGAKGAGAAAALSLLPERVTTFESGCGGFRVEPCRRPAAPR